MKSILMLDCDGTIRRPKGKLKFINAPENQVVVPEAQQGLSIIKENRLFDLVVGITNQIFVEKGIKTLESCIAEQQLTLKFFPQIDYILFCPDSKGRTCYKVSLKESKNVSIELPALIGRYRKPNNGMLLYVLTESGNDYNLNASLMIGNLNSDRQCAKLTGIPFLSSEVWHSAYTKGNYRV